MIYDSMRDYPDFGEYEINKILNIYSNDLKIKIEYYMNVKIYVYMNSVAVKMWTFRADRLRFPPRRFAEIIINNYMYYGLQSVISLSTSDFFNLLR